MSGSDAHRHAQAVHRGDGPVGRIALLLVRLLVALPLLQPALPVAQPRPPAAPEITEVDMAHATQRHRLPPSLLADPPTPPATPRIDALPQPAHSPAPLDLAALARGFDAAVAGTSGQGLDGGPRLLVFVSFSMPERTWQRLLQQAEQAQAVLVLRGLVDGSLRRTVLRMQQLIGRRKVAVQIDPQAFDRHAVTVVPTMVLLRAGSADSIPCSASTCATDRSGAGHLQAAGDVSLDYALRRFMAAAPSAAADARVFLRRLQGGGR